MRLLLLYKQLLRFEMHRLDKRLKVHHNFLPHRMPLKQDDKQKRMLNTNQQDR
jgi:hypothetical protein